MATPAEAARVCLHGRPGFFKSNHLYEKLNANGLMRAYYDAEFYTLCNPDKVVQKEEMKKALHHYVQQAYMEIPNRPCRDPTNVNDFISVETSHRVEKVSFHGKIPTKYGVFDGITSQRAFWAHVLSLMVTDHDNGKAPATILRVKKQDARGSNDEGWFLDTSVYGPKQLMRTVASSMCF